MHEFHLLGFGYSWVTIRMLVIGELKLGENEFHQEDVDAVDVSPATTPQPIHHKPTSSFR